MEYPGIMDTGMNRVHVDVGLIFVLSGSISTIALVVVLDGLAQL